MRPQDQSLRFQWDRGIGFCGFNETEGSVAEVSLWPQDQFPRSQWDRGIRLLHFCKRFHSLNETAAADSAVWLKPWDQIPWSHWDHAIGFHGLNETAEILWHRGNLFKNYYWLHLNGNHIKHHIHTLLENVNIKENSDKKVGSRCLIETAGSDFGDF
jgi:hypothetical protein